MRSRDEMLNLDPKEIFEGFLCGAFDTNGERYQTREGRRLYEFVFLSDRDKDFVYRRYNTLDEKDPWAGAISVYLNKYGFQMPTPTLYCYYKIGNIMITSRKIDLPLNIDKT